MTRLTALIFTTALALLTPNFAHATTVKVRLTSAKTEISLTGMNIRLKTAQDSLSGFGSGRGLLSPLNSFILKPELASGAIRWTVTDKITGRKIRDINGSILSIDGDTLRMGLKPVPNSLVLRA